jgi:hypothetical protein
VKRTVLLALVAFVLAALAAAARGPAAPAVQAKSTQCKGDAGEVQHVVDPDVYVNGQRVSSEQTFGRRAAIRTTSSGQARVCLKKKGLVCTLLGSTVNALPSPGIVMRFGGVAPSFTTCTTTQGTSPATFTSFRPRTKISAPDPLFAVDVRAKTMVVTVVFGTLKVRGRRGPTVVVGPKEQTVVAGGRASAPQPSRLTGRELKATNALIPLTPKPALKRPAGNSPAMKQIVQRGLVVGYEEDPKDPKAGAFVKRFFALLARRWHVDVAVKDIGAADAPALLKSGAMDVWVALDASQFGIKPLFPFLEERRVGKVWKPWDAVLRRDPIFDPAFRDFLVGTLQNGAYATLYEELYGTSPPYRFFNSILFP